MTCGVPQGSILGPKLFILYINDICNASTILKFILFADDTNVFYSGVDIQTLCECISRELNKLHVWLLLFVNQTVCLICVKQYFVQKYTLTNLKQCLSQLLVQSCGIMSLILIYET